MKNVTASLILFSVLLLGPLAASPAAEPADPSKPHPFEKDIAAFEVADKKTPPPQRAILFVGDSTFTRWTSIHDDLKGYTVINRGFGGSQMSDLLYYTDRIVLPYKPRLIIVQEGGNDIHGGKSPEQLLADITAFVEKVHAVLPDVPIAIGSITPNSARWSEADVRRRANKIVKEYVATQKNVSFIDFWDAFLGPDGKPNDDLFVADKMHPSPAGYQLRVRSMAPFLGAPDSKANGQK
jgi:lysophospholipase L1-like esterase